MLVAWSPTGRHRKSSNTLVAATSRVSSCILRGPSYPSSTSTIARSRRSIRYDVGLGGNELASDPGDGSAPLLRVAARAPPLVRRHHLAPRRRVALRIDRGVRGARPARNAGPRRRRLPLVGHRALACRLPIADRVGHGLSRRDVV